MKAPHLEACGCGLQDDRCLSRRRARSACVCDGPNLKWSETLWNIEHGEFDRAGLRVSPKPSYERTPAEIQGELHKCSTIPGYNKAEEMKKAKAEEGERKRQRKTDKGKAKARDREQKLAAKQAEKEEKAKKAEREKGQKRRPIHRPRRRRRLAASTSSTAGSTGGRREESRRRSRG